MNQPFERLNTLFKESRLVHTWHTWYWNDIMIMAPHGYFSVATLALSVHSGPFIAALAPSPVLSSPSIWETTQLNQLKEKEKVLWFLLVVVLIILCVCMCVFIWIRWNHLTTDSTHASDSLEWEAVLLVHSGQNWKGCTRAQMGISQKS